jgi:hypothetical protein
MTLWYYPPKDGKKFANLGGDISTSTANILFTEGLFVDGGNYVQLFCQAEAISDVKERDNKGFAFAPQLVSIKFTKKEYEVEFNGSKRKKTPTRMDLALCKFAEDWIGKPCKGKIQFGIPEMQLDYVLEGVFLRFDP